MANDAKRNAANEPEAKAGAANGAASSTPAKRPHFGPGSKFHGVKGRSGGKQGNTNPQRHGLYSGKLPKGCMYIETRVNCLRRQLEEAVIAAKGEINIVDAAAINSAVKWERHGLLAAHWLRKQTDKLSTAEL